MFGKRSFGNQRKEAAEILTKIDRFSTSKSRIDEVARTLRNQGRDAAEMRAAQISNDPYYGI